MRITTTITAVLAAGILCSGCGTAQIIKDPDPTPAPTSTSTPAPTSTPTPVPTATATATPDRPATCETDDVCFTYDAMDDAYDRAIGFVAPFFEQAYETPPKVDGYIYIAAGEVSDSACGELDSEAAAYCPGDRTIYLGQDAMWGIYDSQGGGDAGLALVLAHEYGHHLQDTFGVPDAATDRETIPRENQADCVAGAWAAWADEQGYFAPGEGDEIAATLDAAADAEGPGRSHGTAGERTEAVGLGLDGGLEACNDYFSSTPLIT